MGTIKLKIMLVFNMICFIGLYPELVCIAEFIVCYFVSSALFQCHQSLKNKLYCKYILTCISEKDWNILVFNIELFSKILQVNNIRLGQIVQTSTYLFSYSLHYLNI